MEYETPEGKELSRDLVSLHVVFNFWVCHHESMKKEGESLFKDLFCIHGMSAMCTIETNNSAFSSHLYDLLITQQDHDTVAL